MSREGEMTEAFEGLRDVVLAPMPIEHTVLTAEGLGRGIKEMLRQSSWQEMQRREPSPEFLLRQFLHGVSRYIVEE